MRGIITNEKYKGDVLMGKTFTVDPISKRRLDNFGEEEKYYIENHHEPIISEKQFEEAQIILRKRSKNHNKGRMNKFSQQYTFSSMISCGFCQGGVTRRRWHSGTDHQKNVWACVTAVKKGKKSCPDSKALEESIIEGAFVEAFNMLVDDNKEIVEEFLKNTEDGLHSKENKKQLTKLTDEINNTEVKISKLLDLHLEGNVDKLTYEEKYEQLQKKLDGLKKQHIELSCAEDELDAVKDRLTIFRGIFDSGEKLRKFDSDVFKSIMDRVILGGYDEDGKPDPYLLTFIFKTGLKAEISNSKGKGKKKGKSSKKTCFNQADGAGVGR